MFTFDAKKWVPKFLLQDKNGYAMAKAIEAAMQAMNDAIQEGVDCITDYSKMPEWRLDELAWEMMIDWYDYNYDIDAKRRTIQSAQEVYKRLGTPYAVSTAIQAVLPNSFIREWQDYGGEPFYFKLWVDTGDEGIEPEELQRILDRIQYYKNARSVLEGVEYIITPSRPVPAYAAGGVSGFYISLGVTINQEEEN